MVETNCEMCGKDAPLFKTEIEGTYLDVCKDCARFGRIVKQIEEPMPVRKDKIQSQRTRPIAVPRKEIMESVVENYAELIKNAREKLGLQQNELAVKIAEKDSVLHNIETGRYEPNIALAKKLQRYLHVKLVEETEITNEKVAGSKTEELTLGDVIKIKKR